jgi:Ca-activated chloride channel family protein
MMAAQNPWTKRVLRALLLPAVLSQLPAITVEVDNPFGDVRVTVGTSPRFQVQGTGTTRKVTQDDTEITRADERVIVKCAPADSEPIDLDVFIPIGFSVDIATTDGAIEINGMIRGARLSTETGSIRLAVPWRATRIQIDAEEAPAALHLPKRNCFTINKITITPERTIWRLRDRLPPEQITYGRVRIRAQAPAELRLTNEPIPPDSPIKLPWQSVDVLKDLLDRKKDKKPTPQTQQLPETAAEKADGAAADTVFRSDVRMVNLVVTATNSEGRPVTELAPDNFVVIEDGLEQEVSFAGSDDVPFNLAILLDLSGSTKPDRLAMREAAKRFVSLARPRDRVAVYALAGDVFHVVAPLSEDREDLIETLDQLPNVAGGSPVYDAIALAYAEELHKRPGERNALIVISDGIDNQVSKQNDAPSTIRFKRLAKAAAEMNALIYPVFLRSGERFGRGWSRKARERMETLAAASHGRLFAAMSIQDLDPVFPLIERELRGVYSVAYYPSNQDFDGKWRSVEVKAGGTDVTIRARPGYYAR